MEHMEEPQQPLVSPTMLSPAAWVSLGKLPGGMGLPACTQQSCHQECHPQSLWDSLGTLGHTQDLRPVHCKEW